MCVTRLGDTSPVRRLNRQRVPFEERHPRETFRQDARSQEARHAATHHNRVSRARHCLSHHLLQADSLASLAYYGCDT